MFGGADMGNGLMCINDYLTTSVGISNVIGVGKGHYWTYNIVTF